MTAFSEVQLQQLQQLLKVELTQTERNLAKWVETKMDEKINPIIAQFSILKDENRSLKQRLNQLENHARRSNLEIIGFPLEPNLQPQVIIQRIANKIGYKLEDSDIVTAHRNGRVKLVGTNKYQDIVVELKNRNVVSDIIEKSEAFRKSNDGMMTAFMFCSRMPESKISIYRQISGELKKLRWLAMKKKEALKFKFCWINRSGKLMMKKDESSEPIWINTVEDIDQLQ